MKNFKLTFPDNSSIEVENEITPVTFLNRLESKGREIMAVKVNNEVCSLYSPIRVTARVEPVFLDTSEGSQIYRRSLCFVLAAASHKIFPGARLLVGHSLDYGYYYTIENGHPIVQEELDLLRKEMLRIIEADEVIRTDYISYSEACELFEKLGLTETRKQLNFRCPAYIRVNQLLSVLRRDKQCLQDRTHSHDQKQYRSHAKHADSSSPENTYSFHGHFLPRLTLSASHLS